MDRTIVYAGGIGQDSDVLKLNRDVLIALGKLANVMLGSNTLAYNLAAIPGTGLTVQVGAGQLYSLQNVDNNAYGSLSADTTHSIIKQGLQLDPVTLTLAAPGTTGQSINYLIEATYSDSDMDNTVLPFYNSANPSQPFSGQNNNGQSLPTRRAGTIALQAKAGTAAATGSQVAPTVDTGYVPLYVVTVNYGDTVIAQSAIKQHWAAPFISGSLLATAQTLSASSGTDTGAANAYAVNISPAPNTYAQFQYVSFKPVNNNTGASTLNLNGLGAKNIVHRDGSVLVAGEMSGLIELIYDGTNFVMVHLSKARADTLYVSAPTPMTVSANTTLTGADAGTLKVVTAAAAITLPPASTVPSGKTIEVKNTTFQSVTVAPQGADQLDGFTSSGSYRIGAYDIWEFLSDGSANWYAVRKGTEVGLIAPYGGGAVPRGWLLCDGTGYATTTYGGLYAVLATAFGSTNGFQVPDYRGRVIVGAGQGSGLTNRVLGASGGEESHVLTTAELAAHAHGINDTGHNHTVSPVGTGGGTGHYAGGSIDQLGTVTTSTNGTGISIQNNGSGSAHNNMQPFGTATMMIKA